MVHGRFFGWVLIASLLAGCGIKQADHDAVVAERDECQADAERWESLYQESVEERRMALDQALEMLPAQHAELRSQIDLRLTEVTQAMDESLKAEVQESVYELAEAIASGYNVLQDENKQLQAQLGESRELIENVLEKADSLEQTAGSIEEQVGAEKAAFLAARQAALLEIGEVEAFVRDWKYTYVDCKGCDERLRINARERDALAQLNDDVVSRLSSVRERLTAPVEVVEPEASPEASEEADAG